MKTAIDCCVVHGLQATDYELQQPGSSRVPVFEALAVKFLLYANKNVAHICSQNALKLGLVMQFDVLLSNLWPLGASLAILLCHWFPTVEESHWVGCGSIIHLHVKNRVTCVKILVLLHVK